MIERCEVLIVGGGLVGASLALALCRAGIATTLVEARPTATALADPERERYLALARASLHALRALTVWPDVVAHAAAIAAVHVSRRGDFGRVMLRADEHGVERLGAVVPASRLGLALESALQRAPGLTRVLPASLLDFAQTASGVEARIVAADGERCVHAAMLVGADGAESLVRTQAGLAVEREDYGQDALVLSMGLSRDHGGIAYERFDDDGAIAALPLPGRRAGLVWTLGRERAEQLTLASEAERMAALQAAFGYRLGRLHAPGRLVRYPLARSYAPQTVCGRVVLVGNAAQALHPVAAQGFNLGLRDALTLAEELARALAHDAVPAKDSASATRLSADVIAGTLRRYVDRRRGDRERIAALSHGLARWPKLRAPGLGLLRSLVLAAINAAPGVRDSLVLAALGHGADAPALTLEPAA